MTTEAARRLLRLPARATPEQLRRAYRQAALRLHPDRGGNAADFRAAREAYELLSGRASEPRVVDLGGWRVADEPLYFHLTFEQPIWDLLTERERYWLQVMSDQQQQPWMPGGEPGVRKFWFLVSRRREVQRWLDELRQNHNGEERR